MSDGRGRAPGEKLGGRQKGTKNKATLERENMISRAMGELDRRRAASRPQRLLRGPQGPPPLRPTKHNAPQARGISSSPWQAFPGRGGGLSHQLLAGPGQCDPARRSQRG